MNEKSAEIYAYFHGMMGAYSAMSEQERAALAEWEEQNLDDHSIGTSDWPGWQKYIGPKPEFEKQDIERSGFVYLIRSGESNKYKIGISKNVPSRLATLQTANPEKMELICAFASSDARRKEAELHNAFEQRRITREWFELSQDDVRSIMSCADQETGST